MFEYPMRIGGLEMRALIGFAAGNQPTRAFSGRSDDDTAICKSITCRINRYQVNAVAKDSADER